MEDNEKSGITLSRMSAIAESVAKAIEERASSFQSLDESVVVSLIRKAEKENSIFSYPLRREIVKDDPTMRNFLRIKTVYRFACMDAPFFIDCESFGDGVDTKIKASTHAMRNSDVSALLEAYKIILPEPTKPVAEKKAPVKKEGASSQKATPDQIKLLANFYTGGKLTKLLQVNKISKLEDIPMSKAAELISKVYKV